MSNKSVQAQGWESGTYVIITIFDDRPPPPTAAAALLVMPSPLNVFPRTSAKVHHMHTCIDLGPVSSHLVSLAIVLCILFLINDDRFNIFQSRRTQQGDR